MRFQNKVAVVTGAGSGIGATVAKNLAAEGARVFAIDKAWAEPPQSDAIVKHECDVTEPTPVADAFSRCKRDLGDVDIVFNNAGIGRGGQRLHEIPIEDFDLVVRVNVRGAFLVLREGLAAMVGRGGTIVNTASTSSFMATPFTGAYSATKAGVMQLTKQAALEYAADGIRVNCVCPGVTATPLMLNAPEDIKQKTIATVPLGRLATPDEIANVMLFLASDEASYVTGSAFVVDGGKIIVAA